MLGRDLCQTDALSEQAKLLGIPSAQMIETGFLLSQPATVKLVFRCQ